MVAPPATDPRFPYTTPFRSNEVVCDFPAIRQIIAVGVVIHWTGVRLVFCEITESVGIGGLHCGGQVSVVDRARKYVALIRGRPLEGTHLCFPPVGKAVGLAV